MASGMYLNGIKAFAEGDIDWASDTIKVMLMKDSYSENLASHDTVSDISSSESDGTNYSRKTISNRSVSVGSTSVTLLTSDSGLTWSTINNDTVGGLVIFAEGASDALSTLICFISFTDQTFNGGDFTITWSSAGIVSHSNFGIT